MKIYCNNLDCIDNEKLEEPVSFKPNKNYVSLFPSTNFQGICKNEGYSFIPIGISEKNTHHKLASCCKDVESLEICHREDCSNNVNKKCGRDVIFVDKIQGIDFVFWQCKCYSLKKISGRMDWSRFPQKSGVSLTDDEARNMNHDNTVSKMYPDHLRQEKKVSKKPKLPPQVMRRPMPRVNTG